MLEDRLAELLATTATLKLASAGGRVTPWLTAAYFAERGLFTIRLLLESSSKSFANIHACPRVAVMIERGDAYTLYAQGEGLAAHVPGAGSWFKADLLAKTPSAALVVSQPNLLPVQIAIERWLLTDVAAGWVPALELRAPS